MTIARNSLPRKCIGSTRAAATMTAIPALMALQCPALAAPSGGTVVAGSAGISQAGSVTNINQSSNRAIINWQGFSIGPQETVNFYQPGASAVTLNRVIGNETSVISGALNANGQVFIVNSAGVLFTKDSQVNVGGLVASTLDISNANFMAGNYVFSGSSAASVVNQGAIHARDGGYVALLGKTVSNEGVISATLGTVAMASGNKITLNFEGDSLIDVTIDEGALNALVENKSAIKADGGRVILTARAADAVLSAQVNNTGVIEARTMAALTGGVGGGVAHTGSIKLLARGGTTHVAGTLDASAPNGGNGGKIETSGDKVTIADGALVTTKAASGKTGVWTLDPNGFNIGYGGSISGGQLSWLLVFSNITIDSVYGSGIDGNVNVFVPVIWQANTTLTLNATNNININAPITATGASAGLALNFGGYAATGSVAAGHDYTINAPVTLSGASASLSINGQAYTLIHSMAQLAALSLPVIDPKTGRQAIDPYYNLPIWAPATGYYALGNNLDASGTVYSRAVVPILTGTLAGMGHQVSNLTINDTAGHGNDGFIGSVGSMVTDTKTGRTSVNGVGAVRDIAVVNVNITDNNASTGNSGPDGALAGAVYKGSTVRNAYSFAATMTGITSVGGLVGRNQGVIDNAHVYSVNISALNGGSGYGGLVGENFGIIENSTAQGKVTAAGVLSDGGGGLTFSSYIGGLVGFNAGAIVNSHTYVDITTTNSVDVGGLVGTNIAGTSYDGTVNPGSITGSTAGGTLNATWTYTSAGGQNYGGLVGGNTGGTISNSSTNVNVNVTATNVDANGLASVSGVGGLVGSNSQGIDQYGNGFGGDLTNNTSYGNVNGVGFVTEVGGGVGLNLGGSISGLQTSGNVNGFINVGGLVGANEGGTVSDSTASGAVNGVRNVSELVGSDSGAVTNNNNTYLDPATIAAKAARAARAAAQAAETAAAAARAANVIATTDMAMTEATPPRPLISNAGTEATAAIAGPKIDDNIKIEEPAPGTGQISGRGGAGSSSEGQHARTEEQNAPSEEPRPRRHVAAATPARKAHARGGAGLGATIRSIDVDGQHYNLQDGSSKDGASDQKAQ
jgi:filamentous hemagglutinin family protein